MKLILFFIKFSKYEHYQLWIDHKSVMHYNIQDYYKLPQQFQMFIRKHITMIN